MEELDDISKLTDTQIGNFLIVLKEEQKRREVQKEISRVVEGLNHRGYVLSMEDLVIPDMHQLVHTRELYFNVNISTHDKRDLTDLSYDDISGEQPVWWNVVDLGNVIPGDIDISSIEVDDDSWDYSDRDDPASGKGKVGIYLYYIRKPYPQSGSFKILNIDDDEPQHLICEVKDAKIYTKDGKYFDDVLNPTRLDKVIIL